jgi:hypothetical protein
MVSDRQPGQAPDKDRAARTEVLSLSDLGRRRASGGYEQDEPPRLGPASALLNGGCGVFTLEPSWGEKRQAHGAVIRSSSQKREDMHCKQYGVS